VLGRHFVLLKERSETQILVLNPQKPMKDYQFNVEKRESPSIRYKRVYLESPGRLAENQPTLELNTVFKVRLVRSDSKPGSASPMTVDQVKTAIDELAKQLTSEGKLTSPREWRRRGANIGLPGLDLPESVGGSGWNAQQMLEVFRHAGRYNLNLRDVVGGAHGRPVVKMDSKIARDALKKLVEGEAYFAVAITEENAGTDTKGMQSRAVKDGDGFRLTGSKLWNARLRQATHVVLYTKAANDSPDARSAFLLPIDHPGLEIIDRYAHGLTGNSFGGLKFDNMYVGPEHLIGKDGDGGEIFDDHFLYWRLMQAAAAIGCGERALEIMAERIRQRHVFGGPIGRFTHLQQPIGENLTKLRMALALAREAARLYDRGDYDAAEPLVNGIKAEGVEIALAACDEAMRAHGALGYSREVDLGDRVRDLMGLRIADGTTDVMRMTVVREKYGFDLWEMSIRSNTESAPKAK
jgi:alkylation response protein AidB-like acyl-CoA dehydrogenase